MNDTVLEVLKWIGIVFAAGFVGYFGRHLAMMLIEKMRRNKAEPSVPEAPPPAPTSPSDIAAASQVKSTKNALRPRQRRPRKRERGRLEGKHKHSRESERGRQPSLFFGSFSHKMV